VAIAGKQARSKARQHPGSRSGGPWSGRGVGGLASRGCRRRGSCWRCSNTGSSSVSSFSRSVKPAMERRRRPYRAVPGGDRRQAVPGRRRGSAPAADRGCRDWSRCRLAGRHRLQTCARVAAGVARAGSARSPAVLPGLCPLDRRSLPRGDHSASVEQCRVAIAGKRRQVEGEAAHRLPVGVAGLVVVSACRQASVADVCQGCRRRGPCWRDSITGSSAGSSPSRLVQPATRRRRRQCRAVPGGDRRQAGQVESEAVHRLPVGRAVAGQGRVAGKPRLPWPGQCWRDSITDSSAGSSSSRLMQPATRRLRRQCRAVPGGDRRQAGQVEGEAAHRLPIGRAVAWSWCRVAGKPRLPWSGQCWRDSITGSSSESSSSRSVKPATRR
jgi:hypothetical protein